MLDVIHFFFEESSRYGSAEEAQAVNELRIKVYKELYNRSYKYAVNTGSNRGFSASDGFDFEPEDSGEADVVEPFNPRHKMPTKSFVAATPIGDDEVNPFKGVLDAPIS